MQPAAQPAPTRDIPPRQPGLEFAPDIPHHWLGGAFITQLFNGLNLVFPDGERFFIQAVRDHQQRVTDPQLRQQVKGFSGQEALHAREHERYFEILAGQGYPLETFLRRFRSFIGLTTRWLPARVRLAMTAGAEHYTAIFGALALEEAFIDQAHPTMRKLILWHAAEEIEHKAVAFDVLRAAHPSYALRLLGFGLATLALFGWSIAGTRMLLREDVRAGRASWPQIRAERHAFEARDGGAPRRRALARMRAYLRRDFHPGQTDELPLAHRRLREIGIAPAA